MERMTFIFTRGTALCVRFLLGIMVVCGCAGQKPEVNASIYRFSFDDEIFRIRSIFSDDSTASCNELIGRNFLAVDYDQDRIIDHVSLGESSLREAQKVYEYGLDRIAVENRLRVKEPSIDRYTHESNDLRIEIISFRPDNAPPFNEFKIIDRRPLMNPEAIVVVDQNADGSLDEVLKGSAALDEVQGRYVEAIEAGLKKGELIKTNGTILVREK